MEDEYWLKIIGVLLLVALVVGAVIVADVRRAASAQQQTIDDLTQRVADQATTIGDQNATLAILTSRNAVCINQTLMLTAGLHCSVDTINALRIDDLRETALEFNNTPYSIDERQQAIDRITRASQCNAAAAQSRNDDVARLMTADEYAKYATERDMILTWK